MARTLSNISELYGTKINVNTKAVSYTEELQKINKIKYNLSLIYFAGLVALMTSLFL